MNRDSDSKRSTIKDIAKITGFSIATVSRVINNKGIFYGKDTYDKVISAARSLNYYPDAIARGLKTKRTYNIAFLVPKTSEFYSEIFIGIQDVASVSGYSVAMYSSKFDANQEKRNINVILSNRLDGIIIATSLLEPKNFDIISMSKVPVVTIEKFLKDPFVPSITIKNREISKKAVEYLISIGHRKIGFISEPLNIGKVESRLRGYKDALADAGINYDDFVVFIDECLAEEIFDNCYNYVKNIFSKKIDLTAIFASTDIIAVSAIKALNDLCYKVPDDISIIGFDGLEITKYTSPSLTTVIQPRYEMGREAMSLLLKIINGEKFENIDLKAKIEIRQSTAPVKEQN
ncbi:MAG: LacI family transcriptional regulator [Actinobacteria bacterium]|nr:LacI family transcriptional regulator [Actinomycetota bacterium]